MTRDPLQCPSASPKPSAGRIELSRHYRRETFFIEAPSSTQRRFSPHQKCLPPADSFSDLPKLRSSKWEPIRALSGLHFLHLCFSLGVPVKRRRRAPLYVLLTTRAPHERGMTKGSRRLHLITSHRVLSKGSSFLQYEPGYRQKVPMLLKRAAVTLLMHRKQDSLRTLSVSSLYDGHWACKHCLHACSKHV